MGCLEHIFDCYAHKPGANSSYSALSDVEFHELSDDIRFIILAVLVMELFSETSVSDETSEN